MGLLGSIGSAIGGGLSNAFGSALSGWVNGEIGGHFDRKMLRYQNDLMRENWEIMNAYNSPSAQMARYKEAGLNPNLIYGQANTSGSIGTPSATSKAVGSAGTLDLFQRMDQMKADTENKYKQNSLLQSQTDYVKEQVRGERLDNDLKQKALDSLGGLNSNPNDPYWYRDIKKVLQWIFDNPSMPSRGVSAVPSLFDYVPELPFRRRLRELGDRGVRK